MYQAGALGWQARQHIFQIGVRVVTIESSALNQAHYSGTRLACQKRTGKQPAVAPNGNRSDLVLDVVVVDGQLPVIHKAGQRLPTPQALVQGFGDGCPIRDLLPGLHQPRVQHIKQRF